MPLPGDGNGDGWVDGQDYLIWADAYGDDPADPPGAAGGDYNDDEAVDGLDYLVWAGNFGAHTTGITVPEPSTAALIVGSLAVALTTRRRDRRRRLGA
ncbi:MAG: PEP-CTERM sorting domain-containing protein [Pirellulales bacterium]